MGHFISHLAPNESFHLFNQLILEVRRKNWGFATPPPWLIVRGLPGRRAEVPHNFPKTAQYIRAVPAVLHACRERRNEFLYRQDVRKNHPTYQPISGLSYTVKNAVFSSMEQDITLIDTPSKSASLNLKSSS